MHTKSLFIANFAQILQMRTWKQTNLFVLKPYASCSSSHDPLPSKAAFSRYPKALPHGETPHDLGWSSLMATFRPIHLLFFLVGRRSPPISAAFTGRLLPAFCYSNSSWCCTPTLPLKLTVPLRAQSSTLGWLAALKISTYIGQTLWVAAHKLVQQNLQRKSSAFFSRLFLNKFPYGTVQRTLRRCSLQNRSLTEFPKSFERQSGTRDGTGFNVHKARAK